METVTAYECEPSCPVKLIDAQSGELRINPGMVAKAMAPMGHHGSDSSREVRADTGGASRFYPQVKDDAELRQQIRRLIGVEPAGTGHDMRGVLSNAAGEQEHHYGA